MPGMKKVYYILSILICLVLLPAFSLHSSEINGLSVNLFLDKQKYHNSEDIMLNVQIKNITDDTISFFVYDSPKRSDLFDKSRGDDADYTTFKPVLFDMNGKNSELIAPYIKAGKSERETLSWMKKREIQLGAGETFMHTQNLRRIYNFETDKKYRLKLHFFPFIGEQELENKVVMSSNELSFTVVRDRMYLPKKTKDAAVKKQNWYEDISENKDKKDELSERVTLNASEVVLLLLNAEKDGQWERALKYIDLDKFIHSYPDFSREYDIADDYDKKIIEQNFIRYLVNQKKDYLIDFKIINEEIDSTGLVSYVSVSASRKSMIKPLRFRYVYRLEKNNESDYLWFVSGLEATIIKSEKR